MRKYRFGFYLLILLFLAGCASMGAKPWSQRTPVEKSLSFMQFYNSQYADTMAMATNPASTPEQKELAKKKKAILAQLWPQVKLYDSYAQGGITISPELETQILTLINQLGGVL